MKRFLLFPAVSVALFLGSCKSPGVADFPYGSLSSGEETRAYTVTNRSGAVLKLTDYGARVISIVVPSRDGEMKDVVVGPDNLETFEKGPERFLGCVIGRYANRIAGASFELDGRRYELDANERREGIPVQCHGGRQGLDRFVWEGTPFTGDGFAGVRFHRMSPSGEGGFPGNLDCYVTYTLTDDNVVRVEYEAQTDKPTVVTLSNHTFFNLKGNEGGYVMDHLLTVNAGECVQNNALMCPEKVIPVEGTPFDFREPHRVDYRLDMPHPHLAVMRGMSACWVLKDWDGSLRKAANLYEPRTGIGVETWTTEPALLTYTGRLFNGSLKGKFGPVEKYSGMLLETIHFPDSPNQPQFPTTVLRPGEQYHSITEWRFYTK